MADSQRATDTGTWDQQNVLRLDVPMYHLAKMIIAHRVKPPTEQHQQGDSKPPEQKEPQANRPGPCPAGGASSPVPHTSPSVLEKPLSPKTPE